MSTRTDKLRSLARALALGSCFVAGVTFAQTPVPSPTATSTPSATPTPSACETVQDCINAAVPTAVASCASSTPACTEDTDKYAVTADEIASRAVTAAKCTKAKQKFSCNACYQRAKDPLRLRFDKKIFHGLLAEAVSQIEAERKVVCNGLTNKGGKHHNRH